MLRPSNRRGSVSLRNGQRMRRLKINFSNPCTCSINNANSKCPYCPVAKYSIRLLNIYAFFVLFCFSCYGRLLLAFCWLNVNTYEWMCAQNKGCAFIPATKGRIIYKYSNIQFIQLSNIFNDGMTFLLAKYCANLSHCRGHIGYASLFVVGCGGRCANSNMVKWWYDTMMRHDVMNETLVK